MMDGNRPLGVLKVDVEGVEWDVVHGMAGLPQNAMPYYLFIELHHERLRAPVGRDQFVGFVTNLGFQLVSEAKRGTESHLHFQATPA